VSFDRAEPGHRQYAARSVAVVLLLGAGYGLHRTAPGAGKMRQSVKDAHNSLMEYLVGGASGVGVAVGLGRPGKLRQRQPGPAVWHGQRRAAVCPAFACAMPGLLMQHLYALFWPCFKHSGSCTAHA
jgi:hypothetical protein